jgi:uncharacterized protein YvpB
MPYQRLRTLPLLLAAAIGLSVAPGAAEAATRISGVPIYGQYPELPAGCEATAVSMVIRWAGAPVSKVDVASAIPRQPLLTYGGDVVRGGDPNEGFVGNPFVKESFGVFAKPLVDVIDHFLPGRGVDLTGKTFAELLQVVDSGRPVAAWVTNKLVEPTVNATWYTKDDEKIVWHTPEHVMTIIGYDDDEIIVNDPADGVVRRYPLDRFEHVWETMGRHALTVSMQKQPIFSVYQFSTWLKDFTTMEESIAYAKLWAHSSVVEKATGKPQWDNVPSRVYQNNIWLGDFASQKGATDYAKLWANAKVIDLTTGDVAWNNYPKQVYQGDKLIKEFSYKETYWAIQYARGYADSIVIDPGSGKTLWKFADQ